MDYQAEVVRLSSSDGTLLEIRESELSANDLNFIQSQDVYKQAQRKVTSYYFCFTVHPLT